MKDENIIYNIIFILLLILNNALLSVVVRITITYSFESNHIKPQSVRMEQSVTKYLYCISMTSEMLHILKLKIYRH